MDLSLTDEQKELKDSAVDFAQNRLDDGMHERDRSGHFSQDGWNACGEFGLQGILVPEAFGGMGLNAIDYAAIMEGAGYGAKDSGLLFSVNAHVLSCIIPVAHQGSALLQETFLPDMGSGRVIAAHAMTEADSGSDAYTLGTTAVLKDDYYILNGSKTFVTNAPVADVFVVYAATDRSKGFFGISCFLVDRETEGLTVGKKIEKMGLRTSPMSDIGLNECRIPASRLIGKEGTGGIIFTKSMEWERGLIMAYCVGVMERQLDMCVKYATTRKTGKTPLSQQQSIAHKIAEMKVRLETSRLMLYKTAWVISRGKTATLDASITKLYISESYIQSCREAMQLFGGYGYTVEYELERDMRDAHASTFYSGTSEIQKNIISSMLL